MSARSRLATAAAAAAVILVGTQCGTAAGDPAARERGTRAFGVVYRVLQHPRCLNCHPAGRVPLQGDASRPHGQNVHGADDGRGRYALRCAACHGERNGAEAHTPPGAPNWHLPRADAPLVFQGRTAAQVARQLADPRQNGGKTVEQVLDHLAHDELVGWGWDPGPGRQPVDVPRADLVAAMREWIDAGCPVPE